MKLIMIYLRDSFERGREHLGYHSARKHWGIWLATESASAALAYGFGARKSESVVVIVEPEHIASN
jgi:RimJ/RimL family protein N-acetyltransferase